MTSSSRPIVGAKKLAMQQTREYITMSRTTQINNFFLSISDSFLPPCALAAKINLSRHEGPGRKGKREISLRPNIAIRIYFKVLKCKNLDTWIPTIRQLFNILYNVRKTRLAKRLAKSTSRRGSRLQSWSDSTDSLYPLQGFMGAWRNG